MSREESGVPLGHVVVEEIELAVALMIAACHSENRLSIEEIDALLGLGCGPGPAATEARAG